MKLRALDQVHVSSVQADSLRPGQEFHVSATLGNQMLKSLPGRVELVDESDEPFGGQGGGHDGNGAAGAVETRTFAEGEIAKEFSATTEKAERAPLNKAERAAPANKASPKAKAKARKA